MQPSPPPPAPITTTYVRRQPPRAASRKLTPLNSSINSQPKKPKNKKLTTAAAKAHSPAKDNKRGRSKNLDVAIETPPPSLGLSSPAVVSPSATPSILPVAASVQQPMLSLAPDNPQSSTIFRFSSTSTATGHGNHAETTDISSTTTKPRKNKAPDENSDPAVDSSIHSNPIISSSAMTTTTPAISPAYLPEAYRALSFLKSLGIPYNVSDDVILSAFQDLALGARVDPSLEAPYG